MRKSLLGWLVICLVGLAASPALATTSSAAGPGRPFELITPADPVAATVYDAPLIDSDGTHIYYSSIGPMPGAPSGPLLASNLAVRSASGWTTKPLGFPYSASTAESFATALPLSFSPDFSAAIWVGLVPLTPGSPPAGQAALYRFTPDEGLVLLTEVGGAGSFIGASDDTQHVFFSSAKHLLPADGTRTKGESIYEIDGTNLRLLDVDSGGSPLSTCGSIALPEGVSRSGGRVFFISPDPSSSCPEPSKVYLRENATTTVPVSESQCTRVDCNASKPVSFAGATPDGSTVFLTTTQQLANADVDESRDLYAFDLLSGTLRLLSESAPGQLGEATEGLVRAADDGSSVYFFGQGRLLPGLGREGGENLYLEDEDGLRFVAPLGEDDPLQISKAGRVAVFASAAPLDEDDIDSSRDVYVYDVGGDSLTLVSMGTQGGNGNFDATIASPIEYIGFGLEPVPRALSEDGKQAFFSTSERLLSGDGNDAADVYGWAEGRLELLSSGTGAGDAEFANASADGSTVVFKTIQTLLSADRDGGEHDFYAARVGGGFPPEPEPAECDRESCLAPSPGRIVRDSLPSEAGGSKHRRGRLRLERLGSGAGREIVERGYTDLRVRVSGPGAVVAQASSRSEGRERPALHGVTGAVRAGTVTLRLRATEWARQKLRREQVLRLRISLRQSSTHASDDIVLRWGGAR